VIDTLLLNVLNYDKGCKMKKLVFILIFAFIVSMYAFSEMTFTLNTGINLLNETYNDDVEYKRFLPGFSEQFRFEFYGRNSIIGFFAQDEFGFYFNSDEKVKLFVGTSASMAAGPSFIIRTPNNNIFFSLSLGPILQWYRETYVYNLEGSGVPRVYTAFDFGGYGDLAIVLKTRGRFLFRLGVASEVFFIRNESGQSLRNVENSTLFKDTPYFGFVIKPHLGFGLGYLFD